MVREREGNDEDGKCSSAREGLNYFVWIPRELERESEEKFQFFFI